MEFYVRQGKIPEFQNLDKAKRTEIWSATAVRRLRDPFSIVALTMSLSVLFFCYTLGNVFIPWSYGGVVGGVIGAGIGNYLFMGIMTPRSRSVLAEEIASRGW